jgi:hypothetical protein
MVRPCLTLKGWRLLTAARQRSLRPASLTRTMRVPHFILARVGNVNLFGHGGGPCGTRHASKDDAPS